MTLAATPIPDPPADLASASPVMRQYFAAKARAPGALVFFRMGDFYELFFEDAARAAEAVGIALTHRGTHEGRPIPMAGVPVHTAESYLAKLIRAGFKVAVCEQMENPAQARLRGAKAVVHREVVRIVTPGTLTDEALLDPGGASRLAAVAARAGCLALASADLSTGEVDCGEVEPEGLAAALAALGPAETLAPDRLLEDRDLRETLEALGGLVQPLPAALAEPAAARARLESLYGVRTLDGFGPLTGAEIAALGLIAAHLEATQGGRAPALAPPRRAQEAGVLAIDPATRASLEIDRTLSGEREGSLLAAMDRTVTAPGVRLLAARLARPLRDPAAIGARLDAVAWLVERPDLAEAVRGPLSEAGDMARALSRLALSRAGPRDLAAIVRGARAGAVLSDLISAGADPLAAVPAEIESALEALRPAAAPALHALADRLEVGLADALPALARDGGFVAAGVSAALDEARALRDDSRRVIAALEGRLAAESGIPLKIRHNAVLGYFVEATAARADPLLRPPLSATFIHRQTLASQLRFTTTELADLDTAIARAGERALAEELALFEAWRQEACALAAEVRAAAESLARLDVAAALARWALETGAVRPHVDSSLAFEAEGARHPVVERALARAGEGFTPNDCRLDGSGEAGPRLSIVTGPNMAGKSTFLRQNALLVILAQAGCFVPARNLRLGVVDRLFSRVGAADDLARGRSTFMAEMVETAAILSQATARSFVILDEIGRGTATWDGLAIAWACLEALHDRNRCRGLFATHYHELAALEGRLSHVSNLCLRAREWKGDLVFVHEVAPGCADRSYGVQVARLAGLPAPVVTRAKAVLARLESEARSPASVAALPLFAVAEPAPTAPLEPSEVERALASLDLDGMSPREAMEALYRLKAMLDRAVEPKVL